MSTAPSRLFWNIQKGLLQLIANQIVNEDHGGFMLDRGYTDNLFIVQQLLEKRSKVEETHMAFIDLKKTYDSIPIWRVLEEFKVNPRWLDIIRELYRDNSHIT